MIHCEDTIEIARAPHEVFAFVDDPARAPEWMGLCVALAQTSPPPRRAGSTLHYRYRQGGREGEMAGAVTEHAPERVVMTFTDPMFEVRVSFAVAPSGAGTRFTHTVDIEPRALSAKLMTPLIRGATAKQLRTDNEKLKALLEAGGR